MGASTFMVTATGATAQTAFNSARDEARLEHGRGGYTGTIAEKGSFVIITLPKGKDAYEYANELLDAADPRVDDKWGPAGCIKISPQEWLFFGWASD